MGQKVEEPEVFIVERIIGHFFDKKQKQILYKIKWMGYDDPSDDTFEPIENLQNVLHLIYEYNRLNNVEKETEKFLDYLRNEEDKKNKKHPKKKGKKIEKKQSQQQKSSQKQNGKLNQEIQKKQLKTQINTLINECNQLIQENIRVQNSSTQDNTAQGFENQPSEDGYSSILGEFNDINNLNQDYFYEVSSSQEDLKFQITKKLIKKDSY